MSKLALGISLILAAAFIFFGAQKFGSENNIFATIAQRSGLEIFEPWLRMVTGAMELLAAVLLIIPVTRKLGAALGTIIMVGAVGFHLSPWLGIEVEGMGKGLFYVAVVMLAATVLNAFLLGRKN